MLILGIYFTAYNLQYASPDFGAMLSAVTFLFLVITPVLTMRILSEEKKNKTDQLLLTSPVSLIEIVLGKYLAMITIFAVPCLIFCLFPLIIKLQGTAYLLVDYSSILAFFLLGCLFIAVGMFLSSLTESPVIAAIIAAAVAARIKFFYCLNGVFI